MGEDAGIHAMVLSMRTPTSWAWNYKSVLCAALALMLCAQWTHGACIASQMRGAHQAVEMRSSSDVGGLTVTRLTFALPTPSQASQLRHDRW